MVWVPQSLLTVRSVSAGMSLEAHPFPPAHNSAMIQKAPSRDLPKDTQSSLNISLYTSGGEADANRGSENVATRRKTDGRK